MSIDDIVGLEDYHLWPIAIEVVVGGQIDWLVIRQGGWTKKSLEITVRKQEQTPEHVQTIITKLRHRTIVIKQTQLFSLTE